MGVPFPVPQVRPEVHSGAMWAQGQFSAPESRSTGPGNQHGFDPCLSFSRIINEKHCRQASKALLGDFQHKILNPCWGVQRAWSSQWQNWLVKWDPRASSRPSNKDSQILGVSLQERQNKVTNIQCWLQAAGLVLPQFCPGAQPKAIL